MRSSNGRADTPPDSPSAGPARGDRWRTRWLDAFTPGNGHFSGNAPVLETDDRAVRRLYYAAIVTLLVLHRTNLRLSDRAFVTSGERDKGDVFFWDTSMFSRLFALLEPRAMREQLALFLQVDPHDGAVFNLDNSRFRGGQYLPGYSHGYWYAANDLSLFTLAHDYVAVTGDRDFLAETVGDRTVDEHLRRPGDGLALPGHPRRGCGRLRPRRQPARVRSQLRARGGVAERRQRLDDALDGRRDGSNRRPGGGRGVAGRGRHARNAHPRALRPRRRNLGRGRHRRNPPTDPPLLRLHLHRPLHARSIGRPHPP